MSMGMSLSTTGVKILPYSKLSPRGPRLFSTRGCSCTGALCTSSTWWRETAYPLLEDPMSIVTLVTEPDAARVNLKTVFKRIKGLATTINSSPQRRAFFESTVPLQQPNSAVSTLVQDVTTRWNSTYAMFKRAMALQSSVQHLTQTPDFENYALNKDEWVKLRQMCEFLESLNAATELLSGDAYPTLGI
ncbi:hypothetical protein OnM2_036083, partial [Erysiphe neolycopersici]